MRYKNTFNNWEVPYLKKSGKKIIKQKRIDTNLIEIEYEE